MITLLVAALASNVVSQPLVVADQVTVQRPLRVVVGVLRPTDGSANTNASFGVSYDFKKSTSKLPTITGAYLDYSWRDRLVSIGAGRDSVRRIGVGAQVRSYVSSPVSSDRFYYGGGLGFYSLQSGGSSSRFGAKLLVGYERNDGWGLEYDVTSINEAQGMNFSGSQLGVSLLTNWFVSYEKASRIPGGFLRSVHIWRISLHPKSLAAEELASI